MGNDQRVAKRPYPFKTTPDVIGNDAVRFMERMDAVDRDSTRMVYTAMPESQTLARSLAATEKAYSKLAGVHDALIDFLTRTDDVQP